MTGFDTQLRLQRRRHIIAMIVGIIAIVGVVFLSLHRSAVIENNGAVCYTTSFIQDTPRVPVGSPHDGQKILRHAVPEGFTAAVGWLTATTATPCIHRDDVARIVIDEWAVITRTEEGNDMAFGETFDGVTELQGGWFVRYPQWFANNTHSNLTLASQNAELLIDLAPHSQQIAHVWTPRFAVSPGDIVLVRARVKVEGLARLEFGVDFWRDFDVEYNFFDEFCRDTHNCEAWVSDWIGDTHGEFVTVELPLE
jgi:hypothetical protein